MPRHLTLPPPSADTPSIDALREALGQLTPDAEPQWGSLDAPCMLRHCSRFMELYLGAMNVGLALRLIGRWLGPPFLRRFIVRPLGETPRNMRTMQPLRLSEGETLDFAEERRLFLEGLAGVESLNGIVHHRLYGSMRAEDAQALVRHHTAHHFYQFGLL